MNPYSYGQSEIFWFLETAKKKKKCVMVLIKWIPVLYFCHNLGYWFHHTVPRNRPCLAKVKVIRQFPDIVWRNHLPCNSPARESHLKYVCTRVRILKACMSQRVQGWPTDGDGSFVLDCTRPPASWGQPGAEVRRLEESFRKVTVKKVKFSEEDVRLLQYVIFNFSS